MKLLEPTVAHIALMTDLKEAIGKHPNLTAMDFLAITSQLVGNLVALQDQTKVTPEEAMEMVALNIETGNAMAIASFQKSEGTA